MCECERAHLCVCPSALHTSGCPNACQPKTLFRAVAPGRGADRWAPSGLYPSCVGPQVLNVLLLWVTTWGYVLLKSFIWRGKCERAQWPSCGKTQMCNIWRKRHTGGYISSHVALRELEGQAGRTLPYGRKEKESFYLLVLSANVCSGQGCAGPKPGVRSLWVPPGVQGP